MNVLSDDQFRLLGFIAACNGSSFRPTAEQVMLWRDHPKPKAAEYRTFQRRSPVDMAFESEQNTFTATLGKLRDTESALTKMLATMVTDKWSGDTGLTTWLTNFGNTSRELVKEAETPIDHLIRLTWVEEAKGDGGLRLTEIGRALLHDHERETTDEDVSVVILEANDPMAYPKLVGQLANAGEGLLVDPYLKLEALSRIVVSTRLTRLLVSAKTGKGELAAMEALLDNPNHDRRVEVRKSKNLHDRLLFAEDQSVFTLGTSLNGVGRTTTVLTPMPAQAAAALRDVYEQLWMEAELVGPQPIEDEQDEQDDDESDDGAADGEGGADSGGDTEPTA